MNNIIGNIKKFIVNTIKYTIFYPFMIIMAYSIIVGIWDAVTSDNEATVDVEESYFTEVKEEYDGRRHLVIDRLSKMEGVTCPMPGGAFYAFAKLPIDDSDKFCQWLLEDFEYNGESVMTAPGTGFYSTPGLGKDEVRIAYVLNKTDLDAALTCLEEALKVYPGRTV